jgi:hypothetical protein
LWLNWARSLDVNSVISQGTSEEAVITAWLELLLQCRDIAADALEYLSRHTRNEQESLEARLSPKTAHDLQLVFEDLLPSVPDQKASHLCKRIFESRALSRDSLVLRDLVEGFPDGVFGAWEAAVSLVPRSDAPTLCLVGMGTGWATRALRIAAHLVSREPGFTVGLVLTHLDLKALEVGDESQSVALLRQGILLVDEVQSPVAGVAETSPTRGVASPPAEMQLTTESSVFERATVLRPLPSTKSSSIGIDDARSAAERYLFEQLEAWPPTRGLFKLNASPGFSMAGREVEVDLLGSKPRVAVEIDGYHHFHDPEAYRRDRRKDLELQLHGYVVVRVLADDVVSRLEEILATIVRAISRQPEGSASH